MSYRKPSNDVLLKWAHVELDRKLIELGLDHQSVDQLELHVDEAGTHMEIEAHLSDERSISFSYALTDRVDPETFDYHAAAVAFIHAFDGGAVH
jgi:hypothetical protein